MALKFKNKTAATPAQVLEADSPSAKGQVLQAIKEKGLHQAGLMDLEVAITPTMKVTLHQPKIEVTPMTMEEALVSEYITLFQKLEEIGGKKLLTRMEAIKKNLQDTANDTLDAAKPAIFKSPDGELEFSERKKVVEVKDPLEVLAYVQEKFDEEALRSITKIGMTELRKLLSEHELLPYVAEKEGSRTLKAVRPL